MTNKEEAFLNFYIASGLNTGRKAELWRLAFGNEVKGIKDSSLETYAKRLLAKAEAKEFVKKHRPNNVVRSEQLLDAIKELHDLLEEVSKVPDILAIRREIRLHLADLSKCVDVVQSANSGGDWEIIEDRIQVVIPEGDLNADKVNEYLSKLIEDRKEPRLVLIKPNEIKEIIPVPMGEGVQITNEDVKDKLLNDEFALAFRSSN